MRTGDIVTFFWFWNDPGPNDRIRYRRRQYQTATWAEATANWLDAATTDLSTLVPANPGAAVGGLHAVPDSAARVWVAFRTTGQDIAVARLTPSTGAIENWTNKLLSNGFADEQPFVLVDEPRRVWVFWTDPNGIQSESFDLTAGTWSAAAVVAGTAAGDRRSTAVLDDDGGIWLLWTRPAAGGDTHIYASRRHPETGAWSEPRQVTAAAGINDFAHVTYRDGSIYLFVRSNRSGAQFDLFYKQLIIAI